MRDFCGELFQDLEKVAPLKGNLEELLGGGQMVAQLRRAVEGSKDQEGQSLISLENCWQLLTGERRDWPEMIRGVLFGTGGREKALKDHCLMIHSNMKAFIATAATAICLECRDGKSFMDWLPRAVDLLDGATTRGLPIEMNSFDDYPDRLAKAEWRIPATLYWTRWWLHQVNVVQTIEAPIAGVDGGIGYIMHFRLQRLPGIGHRFIRHPESAFHQFGGKFLDPIRTLAEVCDFPVCWGVRGQEDRLFRNRGLDGSSASGAAARAIHDLWSGQVPDDGVLVLAEIRMNRWSKESPSWDLIGLDNVEKEDAKFEAAKKDAGIRTVIKVIDGRLRIFDRGNNWTERTSTAGS